jgi:hypothetical protein
MLRYKAEEGSASGHCCFEGSVVDLAYPTVNVFSAELIGGFRVVCECFDMEDAEAIAAALNATASLPAVETVARELASGQSLISWEQMADDHAVEVPRHNQEPFVALSRNQWREVARGALAALNDTPRQS